MPESRKRKRTQHPLRIAFRWCRILFLTVISAVVAVVLWCNVFGLPSFVRNAIKQELTRRSFEVEFAKLRLKGFQQIVAEDVRLKSSTSTNAPQFQAQEAEFVLRMNQLLSGQFEIIGIRLHSGRLAVPLEVGTEKSLIVTNIAADVTLLPGDAVRIVDFSAEALGARARLSGEVRSVSRFRIKPSPAKSEASEWQRHLAEVLRVAEQLEFKQPPKLTISIFADGAEMTAARASVMLRSGEATSRWGTFDGLEISSSVAPVSSNNAVRGNFLTEISGFRTHAGLVESLKLEGESLWSKNMERLLTNQVRFTTGTVDARWFRVNGLEALLSSAQQQTNGPIQSILTLGAGSVEAFGGRFGTNLLHASLEHPLPFPTPAVWLGHLFAGQPMESLHNASNNVISGDWQLESTEITTGRADVEAIRFAGTLASHAAGEPLNDELGVWRFFAAVRAPWQMQATNIKAGEISVGSVHTAGEWKFPILSVTDLDAQLYGGYLKGDANLNVETRKLSASSEADFPFEKMAPLLDKPVQQWIERFTWNDSPFVDSTLSFQLPEWTNTWENLRKVVLSSLQISGRFEGSGSFQGIEAVKASSHFHFTNFLWSLPDLVITRPEGDVHLTYAGNVDNADFYCKVDSRIDPAIFKPLFPKEQQDAAGIVKFVQPPILQAEAWGNWDDEAKLGVRGTLVATNFFVREQAFSDVQADFTITNGLIHCRDVLLHRGKEELRAPYLRVDLPGEVLFVTNAVSTLDPYIAMSLVGEDAYDAIDPYRFAVTPTVRVNGLVPLRHWSKADIHFEVSGNEFSFWRLRVPNLSGDVYWKADTIGFSNIVAGFYGGQAKWSGYFVIDHKDDSANFSFAGYTTNTEVKYLVADLTGKTNQMEGILHGDLIITAANSKNDRSWNGFGNATIEDGYLWNVPVFGIFSPILDGVVPGLGASRINSGNGAFEITNSVVYTRDMQVRAPAFRLGYKGQVDLDGNLDASVEAQIFRDVWVVGKLFSAALWPVSKAFEAKVSGTLNAPKTDLKFVPNFLTAPFRALNAIGNMGSKGAAGSEEPSTGSPPK